ncbi:uncharacterized protein LOC122244728 [Penaeus japonicus]|uniref:uncharacterized protein LOC122244728 n=1 Tax=Penaeus japonicus TaxID=27405 RepID=UPI001C70B793|nr:uncharacterized protein LOC122244728 [Penaeus japonicus]
MRSITPERLFQGSSIPVRIIFLSCNIKKTKENSLASVSRSDGLVLYEDTRTFLDNRPLTDTRPCIRILVYSKDTNPTSPWCYIWFNSTGPPAVSRVTSIAPMRRSSVTNCRLRQPRAEEHQNAHYVDYVEASKSLQMTFIVTCRISNYDSHLKPKAVSLVRQPCERALTLLQVVGSMERNASSAIIKEDSAEGNNNSQPQWNVAVCGPALFYYHQDISIRLVEWLELLRALGFAKVFLYETDVHPNIQKALQHYVEDGFVSVTKFTYPEPYLNEPSTRRLWTLLKREEMFTMENMYFTDCVLRHMHEFRFIAHFDPDEMPMLPKHDSFPLWISDQMRRNTVAPGNKRAQWQALQLGWYYHNDDLETSNESLPNYMWMLRHPRRSYKTFLYNVGTTKPVFNMDIVLGVNSHMVIACAAGYCQNPNPMIPRNEAYVAHFKKTCGDYCKSTNSTEEEPALLRYQEKVVPAVTEVLKKLQLI